MKSFLLSISILISSVLFSQKINNGNDVIAAMYKKYDGGKKWYKYFSFTQDAIFYKNDSIKKTEVWHEIGSFPGQLAIKYDKKDSKDGVIFSVNKVYSIKDGVVKEPRTFIHDLILVGFDAYFLKPEITIHLLDSLGYNLKSMHIDEFEGRKVYVVGADGGDDKTPQFWIDVERLYLSRIVYKKKDNVTDCVFGDYQKVNGNWVAKKITFKNNGVLMLIEKYYDLKFPKELNPDIFNPEKFAETKW